MTEAHEYGPDLDECFMGCGVFVLLMPYTQIQAMNLLLMIKYILKRLIYELGSHALAPQK